MTSRTFSEVISTYRLRFNGLAEEYRTIDFRWKCLHSALMDYRLLPDLTKNVGKALPKFLRQLDRDIKIAEKISKSSVSSELNVDRDRRMKRVSDGLLLMARFLSYMKSAFYQRTISLEIPYVLAGLPISPEIHWGDELYLIAADNLIRNYANQLDLHDFPWSEFTSYAPMHPHYSKFPGATYSSFVYMFHIALSSEMKYFLNGFLILSHELGHASIESQETRTKRGQIPEIMYRFLWELHPIRRRVYSYLKKKLGGEGWREECEDCLFREDLCDMAYSSREFAEFIEDIWDNVIIELFYEIAADLVGLIVSGPNYIRALFDYAFKGVVTWRQKAPELDNDFQKLLIRIIACAYFADARGLEWSDKTDGILRNIILETNSSIALMDETLKDGFVKCIACLRRIGFILGHAYAKRFDHIFSNTFRELQKHPDSWVFRSDPKLLKRIRKGSLVCRAEPRQIIHACFELMEKTYHENPVALFSLANNTIHTRKLRKCGK